MHPAATHDNRLSHGNLTALLLTRLGQAISFEASLRPTNPDLNSGV